MTERERDDRKRLVQFLLTTLGGALLLGSAVGALYGAARDTIGCWCHDGSGA